MDFFRPKQKVHLSPKLARTIGKTSIPAGNYFGQIVGVLLFGAVLSYLFFGGQTAVRSTSEAAEGLEGEVLGAQNPDVLDYVIKSGDTLLGISERYNVYWMTIVEENELSSPYLLKSGQTLRIPLPRN